MADLTFVQSADPVAIFNDSSGNQLNIDSLGQINVTQVINLLTRNNKTYGISVDVNGAIGGADNSSILIRNPNGSGKVLHIFRFNAGVNVTNVLVQYKIFANPTVTINGTSVTPTSLHVGGGASASVALITTLPTVTVLGTSKLWSVSLGQNSGTLDSLLNGEIIVEPNNSIVITAQPASNNRESTFCIQWAEL